MTFARLVCTEKQRSPPCMFLMFFFIFARSLSRVVIFCLVLKFLFLSLRSLMLLSRLVLLTSLVLLSSLKLVSSLVLVSSLQLLDSLVFILLLCLMLVLVGLAYFLYFLQQNTITARYIHVGMRLAKLR